MQNTENNDVSGIVLLIAGAVLAVTGVVSMQQHRDVDAPEIVESWWKILLAGPALIVLIIVLNYAWPRSLWIGDDVGWLLMFSGVMLAISLVACGVMLGLLRFFNRPRASH